MLCCLRVRCCGHGCGMLCFSCTNPRPHKPPTLRANASIATMMAVGVIIVCVLAQPSATHGAPTAAVVVDFGAPGDMPSLPHTWKRSFGSGHAALGLRPDWLAQLKQARDELGLQGVRQHGLFDDDMGPVVTGHRTYNFSSIERLWSSMVEMGLHPVVELSFMPSFLANCSWQVTGKNCHADYGIPCGPTNPGRPRCRGGMAYAADDGGQLPANWDDWRDLVQQTVQLAVHKFGLAEVQQWRFEVWK
jgi:xylan 1,4-beta-xylosidase